MADGEVTARKVKRPRMTYRQEIQTIKNMPKIQRLIVVMKVAGVFLVAIGLEGIVSGNFLLTVIFIPLGIFVSLAPIKVRIDRCITCQAPLSPGTSICTLCGAPQM